MATTSVVIESAALVVSVLVASGLAYWFGSRTARNERLFDARVSKYDELILLLDNLRAGVVIFKLLQDHDATKSDHPFHDLVWIAGLSGRALGTDRLMTTV